MAIFRESVQRRSPSIWEKAASIRQFAVMIQSGVTIPRAVMVLQKHCSNQVLAAAWGNVAKTIMQGSPLSRGMANNSHVFGMLDVGMARAAEASSQLGPTFNQLADLLERQAKLKRAVTSALHYPLILCLVCVLATVLVLEHVMPVFAAVFASNQLELPLLTRVLIVSTAVLRSPAAAIGIALMGVSIFLVVRQYLGTPIGTYQLQQNLLKMPVVSRLYKELVVARFCRIMGVLLESGLPLAMSLEVAGTAVGSYPLAAAVEQTLKELKLGCRVSEALELVEFFPNLMVRMVAVAEEYGNMASALQRLGQNYEQQVELNLEQTTTALEPVIIGLLGCVVGMVLVGLFVPLYQLVGNI